jgi:hypothetical protein
MMLSVFPPPLLIPNKLFQVSQTYKDACRLDDEYLLSSPLLDQATHLPFPILGTPNFVNIFDGFIWGY